LAASRSRNPVDFGNDRLRKFDYRLHDSGAKREGMVEKASAAIRVRAMRGHLLQIMTSRKQLAFRREDHHPDGLVSPDIIELNLDEFEELD
jgi:hypothetical protein